MTDNQRVIQAFFNAFQRLDHAGMNSCYSQDIVYSDPVYQLLQGDEIRSRWEMFCGQAKDIHLKYADIEAVDDEYYTCKWELVYRDGKQNRKLVKKAKAYMRLHNGKITEHSDAFRLSTWMAQVQGLKGLLFGWTGFMKRAFQRKAKNALVEFMQEKSTGAR